jgi:5'(3')-deoxyribonucleotidase
MIIYVDMDDVICDYSKRIECQKEKYPEVKFPQSVEGFFRGLEPVFGAIEAVEKLRAKSGVELYILTAPSTRNPLSYTEKRLWVEEKFDYELTKNLIMCSNKGLLKGDILIDDHDSGRGQESFEGRLIHFGTEKYRNWGLVLNSILKIT